MNFKDFKDFKDFKEHHEQESLKRDMNEVKEHHEQEHGGHSTVDILLFILRVIAFLSVFALWMCIICWVLYGAPICCLV